MLCEQIKISVVSSNKNSMVKMDRNAIVLKKKYENMYSITVIELVQMRSKERIKSVVDWEIIVGNTWIRGNPLEFGRDSVQSKVMDW